jgi:hypothetical protein
LVEQAQLAEREALLVERQAQSADYAAAAGRESTKFEVARQQEQAGAFKSQQRADIAVSGLEASGSPLIVMSEMAKQLELDKLAIEHAGETRA